MIINIDDKRKKTLSEELNAIDTDAAARGYAYEVTGLTGNEKIDYSFSRDTDLEEFHRQQDLQREAREKMKFDKNYISALKDIDKMLKEL